MRCVIITIHDEKGRVIVTIEGKDSVKEELKKTISVIEAIPHVIASADMQMAYSRR